MKESELISLYDNRWEQIRHLNDLDRRSLILAVTALTGAAVGWHGDQLDPELVSAIAILASIVCVGAIHTTIRNRESMLQALHTIHCIESRLQEADTSLFPWVEAYKAPNFFIHYAAELLLSIRGPLLAFFATALAILLALLGSKAGVVQGLGVFIAFAISGAVLYGALFYGWKKAEPRCKAINKASQTSLEEGDAG